MNFTGSQFRRRLKSRVFPLYVSVEAKLRGAEPERRRESASAGEVEAATR